MIYDESRIPTPIEVAEWISTDPRFPRTPKDFLGQEIKVSDIVCYPTGGQSARMVMAEVISIKDTFLDTPPPVFHSRGDYDYTIEDGTVGFRVTVQRLKEGHSDLNNPRYSWQKSRKATIDQLHRVVVITSIVNNENS